MLKEMQLILWKNFSMSIIITIGVLWWLLFGAYFAPSLQDTDVSITYKEVKDYEKEHWVTVVDIHYKDCSEVELDVETYFGTQKENYKNGCFILLPRR